MTENNEGLTPKPRDAQYQNGCSIKRLFGNPLVSVQMVTYNHESYIAQAIEGVLMQKTSFKIELVIGEDCSTDSTRKICEEYANKYSEIIKLLPSEGNLGMQRNSLRTFNACSGKYIAICEGDDYWTDPYKLQKQVDFMEINQSFVFCVHRYKRFICNQKSYADDLFTELFLDNNGIVIDKTIFSKYWLTQPLTALVRRNPLNEIFQLCSCFHYFRDISLFYLLLNKGNGFCMNFFGGVYNIHDSGIQAGLTRTKQILANFHVIRELYLYCPDPILELSLINCITGLMKSQKSISPILLIFSLDVKPTQKIHIIYRLNKVLIKKIIQILFYI